MRKTFGASGRNSKHAILKSVIGGIAASIGVELFLHPHELIAGGVTGISGLVSFHTDNHFGMLLVLFNLPLLFFYSLLGRKKILLQVLPGLLAFAGSAFLLAPLPAVSGEPVIAALAGGLCLGFGGGLAVKSGGLLDALGLEKTDRIRSAGIQAGTRPAISVERLLLLCHALVLVTAGAALGWERTLYSAFACLAAYETAGIVIFGFRRLAGVTTANPRQVEAEMKSRLRLEGLAWNDAGIGHDRDHEIDRDIDYARVSAQTRLMYSVHLLDVPRFKAVVRKADPQAEIVWVERSGMKQE
ncbi:YitT family protein [Paenibacillus favisporus]|uniref:YitT family protein n=1 Tax=Paenibacillus favisporus TaxID=221028 RepID=UPI0013D04FF2|nr:YitT family protein [Paenibacillus favisporus]